MISNELRNELYEAYIFLGLSYPTEEAAVHEAYYNKMREIRQSGSSQQYTLLYKAKKYRDILIDNIQEPMSGLNADADANEEELAQDESSIKDSVFINEDNTGNTEEFLAWEDIVQVNTIKTNNSAQAKKRKKRRLRLNKTRKILPKVLGATIGICLLALIITNLLVKAEVYKLPDDVFVYDTIKAQGLILEDEQHIPIDDDDIATFSTAYRLSSAANQKAIITVKGAVRTELVTLSISTTFCFDKENDEWVYEKQYTSSNIASHNLIGTWKGSYKASKDAVTTTELTFNINEKTDYGYIGTCNIATKSNKQGSYYVEVSVGQEDVISIRGLEWIEKPTFFIMEDYNCVLNIEQEELLPYDKEGSVFIFTKVNE